MNPDFNHLKKTARLAGLLYLIMAVTGAVGIMYIPSRLIIPGDINMSAMNILNHELLFRAGIFSGIVCQIAFLFLALTLYRLFDGVDRSLPRMLVAVVITSIPVAFIVIFYQLASLSVLKEQVIDTVAKTINISLFIENLRMFSGGNLVMGFFWGIWLIPFGLLVKKSKFIPAVIGILLVAGGITYIADATVFILFPGLHQVTNIIVAVTSSIAELSAVLWLLVVGVRVKGNQAPVV